MARPKTDEDAFPQASSFSFPVDHAMARKLKTFVTKLGFFEQAVAAPSMKAALEAWGVTQNLFHQGFATETEDSEIIAAATAQPGVVLKRAVGTQGKFKEDAELPTSLPAKSPASSGRPKRKEKKTTSAQGTKANRIVERAQMASFEKARAQRERSRAKELEKQAAAEARDAERRAEAIREAQLRLEKAQERHKTKLDVLERQRQAAEREIDAEMKRWRGEKTKLEHMLRNANR